MELAGTFGCVVFQQHYGFSHIDDIIPVATRFFSGRLSSLAVEALPWRIVSSGAGMRLEISQAAFYFSIIFSNFVHFWYFIISDYTSRWFVVKIKEDCDVILTKPAFCRDVASIPFQINWRVDFFKFILSRWLSCFNKALSNFIQLSFRTSVRPRRSVDFFLS